jgi:hypothetical protein
VNYRKKSPLHDKWGKVVEGQIRDCIIAHPEYFDLQFRKAMIESLAKRIVGEIVVCGQMDNNNV